MNLVKIFIARNSRGTIPKSVPPLLILLLATGCSSISIDAAKSLSATGRSVAVQTQQNILVSDIEYLRARDVEALLHGYNGSTDSVIYIAILKSYNDIHKELSQRTVVFENLTDVYDAFGNLAELDASKATETALGNLGGAINEYAKVIKSNQPISKDSTAVISKIGGLISGEIQKAKIKEASNQIQGELIKFLKLLETPIVREQMQGFKQFLATDRKDAIKLLWQEGLFDPTPLLNDIGADAALTAQKDVANVMKSKPALTNALGEVIDKRLEFKIDLIEQAYSASIKSIKKLIAEHEKLEEGKELDLVGLQAIVSQLRAIVTLLSNPRVANSITTP